MLATDAPPAMHAAVPPAQAPSARTDSVTSPLPANTKTDTTLIVSPTRSLTWMRQLALVLVYYLVFKAAATNPITANVREHLRAKLAPSQRSLVDALRSIFRR